LSQEYVRHKGVVKEKDFHVKALKGMLDFLKDYEISIEGIRFSRIKGASGNIEFWIYLRKSINSAKSKSNYDKIIDDVVNEAHLYFAKDRPYL
jgi:23S rRNA (cytidine1920-2'-O)/16S rRNA (cytidine1409-2'-O)-methyltransferase